MKLEASLIVSDPEITLLLDGSGNVILVEEGICAVGSGGLYAKCKYHKFLYHHY